jgi:hypothetical protein
MSEEQKNEEVVNPTPQEGFWRYPEAGDEPAPKGVNVLLLTDGGSTTIGIWGAGVVAWHPQPKRVRSKEPTPYYKNYGSKS